MWKFGDEIYHISVDENVPSWAVRLQRKGNYYEGTVEDVNGILLSHKQSTVTMFGTRKSKSVSSQVCLHVYFTMEQFGWYGRM